MLAKPQSPAGKTVFPAPHTTTTAAGKLSPICTNSGLKSIKKVPAGKEKLSQPGRNFQLCRSLSSRHSFSACLPCSLSKNACIWGSNVRARLSTADCGIGSVLFSKMTRLADIPLFCSSLFLSQPSRRFGVGSVSLPPPVVPLQAGKIVCHSLTWEACHFKAFAV